MNFKDLLIHIGITIVSIIGTYPYELINGGILQSIYGFFHLIIIFFLYFIYGFYSTDSYKKTDTIDFFTITIIGITFLIMALINSPTDFNWKNGEGGILWLIYTFYVSGIQIPFDAINNFSFNPINYYIKIAILSVFSIIPGILILLGSLFKRKRLNT
jgi:hypothetical protein